MVHEWCVNKLRFVYIEISYILSNQVRFYHRTEIIHQLSLIFWKIQWWWPRVRRSDTAFVVNYFIRKTAEFGFLLVAGTKQSILFHSIDLYSLQTNRKIIQSFDVHLANFSRKNVIFMQTVESIGKGTDCRFTFFKIKRFAWASNSFLSFSYITFSMNGTNSDLRWLKYIVSLLKCNSISVRLLWFYTFSYLNGFLFSWLVCLFVNVIFHPYPVQCQQMLRIVTFETILLFCRQKEKRNKENRQRKKCNKKSHFFCKCTVNYECMCRWEKFVQFMAIPSICHCFFFLFCFEWGVKVFG